ncbi:hypothetical protein M409DRAFT_55680 [Zasmidium cellare ATCC 36951]|uniref:WW domain-containing protein n=1 Tax=Zasmidium cellare ATCC 36951 TaxID=1080233 RepID=A0A6A6CI11_ZASCE|nr:uncharacterized protein M409DRAFT_55680 [Zasmidium cellare ATCC 36951]KAF2165820.1 hypothetical protein M409DRAFT_55680 [Zasmidium cellare ATCC 36951]
MTADNETSTMQGIAPSNPAADPFWHIPGIMCNSCSQKRWLDCDFAQNGAPCNNCKHFCGENANHRCNPTSKSWRDTILHMAGEALAARNTPVVPDPKDRNEGVPMQHIPAQHMGPRPSNTPPALPQGIQQDAFAAFGAPRPNTPHRQGNSHTAYATHGYVPPPPPAPPSSLYVPAGWYWVWDHTYQRPYYVQQMTGRTQWEKPQYAFQQPPPPPPPPSTTASIAYASPRPQARPSTRNDQANHGVAAPARDMRQASRLAPGQKRERTPDEDEEDGDQKRSKRD